MKARHFGYIALLIAASLLSLSGCGKNRLINPHQPVATNGYIDISGWDFQREGMIRLGGQWDFYWTKLVTPAEIASGRAPAPDGPIQLPGYWIDSRVNGEVPEMQGYATYVLKAAGLTPGVIYGLAIPDMAYSYRLWVNGRLISTNGVVGTNRATTVHGALPVVEYFESHSPTAVFVLQIANFAGLSGGCSDPILFGVESDVKIYRMRLFILEVFLTSALLIMSVYHFVLYLFIVRRTSLTKNKERRIPFILYFSFVCLLLAIHSGFTKQRFLLDILPGIPWTVAIRIELITWMMLLYGFAAFLNEFFQGIFSRRLTRLFEFASLGLGLFVLVVPTRFTSYAELPFEIFGVAFIFYACYVLLTVALKRDKDRAGMRLIEAARIMAVGLIVLIVTGMNDYLYSDSNFIRFGILTYVGVIFFVMLIAFAIVWRFPDIFVIIRPKRPRQGKGILMAMIEAGGGHKSPAMATKEAMEELFPAKYEISVSDFTKDVGALEVDEKHKKQWQFLLANPAVTMLGYYVQDSFGFVTRALLKDWIQPFIEQGGEWLRKNPPQVFVSFHFMNTIVAIEARKKYELNYPIVTYLTEPMDAHSMWVWKETDIMIVSSKTAKYQLVQRGFPEEKVFIVPYPVRPSFFKIQGSISAQKKKLGMNPDYKTIIISSGAEGIGRIVPYTKGIIKAGLPVNLIVICGKNARLKTELDEMKNHYTGKTVFIPMGYVPNMNEFLNLADIAAIKASPGSTFEALLLNKAVIHMQYVTPSEKANTKFILKNKIGWYAPTVKRFIKTIEKLIEDEGYFKKYLDNLEKLELQNGSYELAKLIDWIAFI